MNLEVKKCFFSSPRRHYEKRGCGHPASPSFCCAERTGLRYKELSIEPDNVTAGQVGVMLHPLGGSTFLVFY